ncbi:outer membrane protein assembly factor BamD [Idiomarina sp. HP20-50]|uniref:outer membrane protein assembly factor BamD n=1 Tax=Idiomarina sp. HP20-50 TaxID=3070813 RepID=UPI00294AB046|nr:outer membrane protein assembly factor BamD [Idiomarina sp. HP20-50]MDV6317301.1 outer membrane protein assembly factor BamD [Idiomarina sp. HP20-50]
MLRNKLGRNVVLSSVLGLMLAGCSSQSDENQVSKTPIEYQYANAQESIANGNLNLAQEQLSQLSSRYPFGPFAHQIQLDLIYLNYKLDNTDQALAAIDRFISLNPNHKDVDYALYMRGLVNQRAEHNAIHDIAGVDRSDRDSSMAQEAFKDFAELVQKYPESEYAADAKKRLIALKSRLAQKELAVAQYYMQRQAYLAAANRGRYVLKHFSETPEVENALAIMVESYDQLELPELREDAMKVLRANFPDNQLVAAQ